MVVKMSKYIEFYKEFKLIDSDKEEWFIPSKLVSADLKQSGWKIKEPKTLANYHKKFNDLNLTCTNPNFYNDGEIIAESRKSIVMACGHSIIKYKNREYWEPYQIIKNHGYEALKDLDNWEWLQVMDWIIVTKKDNKLLAQFSNLSDLPNRKELEK